MRCASSRAAGTAANVARIIVGTTPTNVTPSVARLSKKAAGSNRERASTVPPCRRVSSATQMPKLNVSFSTSSVTVDGPSPNTCWFCTSLPANAACESTAPFGVPVDPEVKITSAAPARRRRRSASSRRDAPNRSIHAAGCAAASRSTRNRHAAFACIASTTPAGAVRWTGTTTARASHVPRNATKSSGWFEHATNTGSSASMPASRSASATARACSSNAE